jgi:NlpC/P60 family putative phage cell wall peptidase
MITRQQIVDCARTYIGTPFRHQGRIKGLGLDCVGLPLCVARDLGLSVDWIERYNNYAPFPVDDMVLQECKRNLIEVSVEVMRPGDIICCRVPVPCHVALVSELPPNLGMIHAYDPNRKVVEHDLDFHWRRRIAGVFVFPEVID